MERSYSFVYVICLQVFLKSEDTAVRALKKKEGKPFCLRHVLLLVQVENLFESLSFFSKNIPGEKLCQEQSPIFQVTSGLLKWSVGHYLKGMVRSPGRCLWRETRRRDCVRGDPEYCF